MPRLGSRSSSSYVELAPPAALDRFVECLWVQQIGDGDEPYAQPVLPDGCIDLVVVGDELVVAGPATHSTMLQLDPGALTTGVRFRTGAAPALLGVSAADLRDQEVPAGDLWGRAGSALATQAVDATGWKDRLEVLVDGLVDRLDEAPSLDPVGVGIVPVLAEPPGRPFPEIARDVGLSERQLRRRIVDAVGYSPRVLTRVLRFQRFLRAARRAGSGRSLGLLAAEAGYADQAHLTRESRELAGLPPAALLDWEAARLAGQEPRRPMSGTFNTVAGATFKLRVWKSA